MPRSRAAQYRPVAPFAGWLVTFLEGYEGRGEAANALGCDEAQIRRWIDGGYYETHDDERVWIPLIEIAEERVDEMLTHLDSGATVSDIWPEADEDVELLPDRYCVKCVEEVTPLLVEGVEVCPWCDWNFETVAVPAAPPTFGPRRKPPKYNRKDSQPRRHKPTSLKHLTPAPPPDLVGMLQAVAPRTEGDRRRGLSEAFVREAMVLYAEALPAGESLLSVAEILVAKYPGRWASAYSLYSGLVYALGKRGALLEGDRRRLRHSADVRVRERSLILEYLRRPNPGFVYRGPLDPALIWDAAWHYYYDGWGFKRTSEQLVRKYALRKSPRTLSSTLYNVFKTNGWPTRPQREATAAANYRHGLSVHHDDDHYRRWKKRRTAGGVRPRCDATSKVTGRRCASFAMIGDSKCFSHSPRTQGKLNEGLAAGRRMVRDRLVDSGPFVLWLTALVERYGSNRAAAKVLGMSSTVLGRLIKRGRTNPGEGERVVSRELIAKALAAALVNDPELQVPRFNDLYTQQAATPPT